MTIRALTIRIAPIALFLTAVAAGAQQIGGNATAGIPEGPVFKVQSQLVVESVVVKDKQGKFVHGLTAKDFTVTEDGAPQTVRFCEHEALTETAKMLPASARKDEDIHIYNRLAHTQIAAESIDNPRYKNRRLLALYFDMTGMFPPDQTAYARSRAAVYPHPDDIRRRGCDHALPGRRGRCPAGLHRGSRSAAEHS